MERSRLWAVGIALGTALIAPNCIQSVGAAAPASQASSEASSGGSVQLAPAVQLAERQGARGGAAPRAVAPRTMAPRTAAPRTVAPRTVAPRTVAPRTVAPRTVAPRTMRSAPRYAAPGRTAIRQAPRAARSVAPGVRRTYVRIDRGARYSRYRVRRPGFVHYYQGWWYPFAWWIGTSAYYGYDDSCQYWHDRCVARWGYNNSNYYGCMRYHGCY
jgi:hypothetical protein